MEIKKIDKDLEFLRQVSQEVNFKEDLTSEIEDLEKYGAVFLNTYALSMTGFLRHDIFSYKDLFIDVMYEEQNGVVSGQVQIFVYRAEKEIRCLNIQEKIDAACGSYFKGEEFIVLPDTLDYNYHFYDVPCFAGNEFGLEKPLHIATLDIKGDRYDELSDKIIIKRMDPSLNSTFVMSVTNSFSDNSLYVECGSFHRYVDSKELYTEQYYNGYGSEKNYLFNGETCITSAIDYVSNGEETVIYMLGGHSEGIMSSDYVSAIENLNIEIRDLSIILDGDIPEDADAIFVCAPAGDVSKEEEAVIFDYLRKGGRMMLITYPTDGNEHANIEQLMSYYGLDAVHGYVMEGDSRYMAGDAVAYVLPSYTDHQIVAPLANGGLYVSLFAPQGLWFSENQRDTLSVTPLLISSDKAYAKPSGNVDTYEKEAEDVEGPFIFAAAVDETVDGVNTRIVWITSDAIIDDNFNNRKSGYVT